VAPFIRNEESAVTALTIIGGMALHRYQSINPGYATPDPHGSALICFSPYSALKAVSGSLMLYLADIDNPHLPLAIELASKGFSTWQTYLDPMDLLRHLFRLSTLPNASHPTSSVSIPALARLAVLHVATLNSALFMSTLYVDILDAKTVEGRKSIMKLCVYMARKKPGVLEGRCMGSSNGYPERAGSSVS
jgi:hypothetical protein